MQLPKPTSQIQAAGLILGTVTLANILTTWVLIANLDAMVYPSDADAIMIPIANNFLNSLCILLWASMGVFLPRHRLGWRIASRIVLGLAALYTLTLTVYWWYPFHYAAGASFLPAVAACAWALWLPASKQPAPGANMASS